MKVAFSVIIVATAQEKFLHILGTPSTQIGYIVAHKITSLDSINKKIEAEKERLHRLMEQKNYLEEQEQTYSTIGKILCEKMNCSHQDFSFDAFHQYIDEHCDNLRNYLTVGNEAYE